MKPNTSLSDFIKSESKQVEALASALESAQQIHGREVRLLEEAKSTLISAQKAQELIQGVAQAVQQKAHEKIAYVVTSCLKSVFDDPYEFRIDFERKRGKTEAKLLFVRNGLEIDPVTASGGGVIDVASFALRVACLVLHRPRLRQVVVLDEPFKFVSVKYRDKVRMMLEQLSEEMKIQIILVTHEEAYETGKIIEL